MRWLPLWPRRRREMSSAPIDVTLGGYSGQARRLSRPGRASTSARATTVACGAGRHRRATSTTAGSAARSDEVVCILDVDGVTRRSSTPRLGPDASGQDATELAGDDRRRIRIEPLDFGSHAMTGRRRSIRRRRFSLPSSVIAVIERSAGTPTHTHRLAAAAASAQYRVRHGARARRAGDARRRRGVRHACRTHRRLPALRGAQDPARHDTRPGRHPAGIARCLAEPAAAEGSRSVRGLDPSAPRERLLRRSAPRTTSSRQPPAAASRRRKRSGLDLSHRHPGPARPRLSPPQRRASHGRRAGPLPGPEPDRGRRTDGDARRHGALSAALRTSAAALGPRSRCASHRPREARHDTQRRLHRPARGLPRRVRGQHAVARRRPRCHPCPASCDSTAPGLVAGAEVPRDEQLAKLGLAAAAVVVAALLGFNYLVAPNIGGPGLGDPTPQPTPISSPSPLGGQDPRRAATRSTRASDGRRPSRFPMAGAREHAWVAIGPKGNAAPDGWPSASTPGTSSTSTPILPSERTLCDPPVGPYGRRCSSLPWPAIPTGR